MRNNLAVFEGIVRKAYQFSDAQEGGSESHPFEQRNVHFSLPIKCRSLFDDGHFSECTFEALKFLDKKVQELSGEAKSGTALMMSVFGGSRPRLSLNALQCQSDLDEQDGYKFIFAGIMLGLRNPKGHEYNLSDDPDTCLDHLSIISHGIRRLEAAGFSLST